MPLRTRTVAVAALLFVLGSVLALGATAGSSPAGETVTLTVPTSARAAVTTVVVGTAAANAIQAARDDPDRVAALRNRGLRESLAVELVRLDAFLLTHPALKPYRAQLWFVAHHSRPPVDARRLAGLLWCTVWYPNACK